MNHPFPPPLPLIVLGGLRMRHPTHRTPRNHNLRPPHVHGEPKGGGEVPAMLLFFLALVVLVGSTPPASLTADEGGEEQS